VSHVKEKERERKRKREKEREREVLCGTRYVMYLCLCRSEFMTEKEREKGALQHMEHDDTTVFAAPSHCVCVCVCVSVRVCERESGALQPSGTLLCGT